MNAEKIRITDASGDKQQESFQNACLTTHTLPNEEIAISIAIYPKLPPSVTTITEAKDYLTKFFARLPTEEDCELEIQIGPN